MIVKSTEGWDCNSQFQKGNKFYSWALYSCAKLFYYSCFNSSAKQGYNFAYPIFSEHFKKPKPSKTYPINQIHPMNLNFVKGIKKKKLEKKNFIIAHFTVVQKKLVAQKNQLS